MTSAGLFFRTVVHAADGATADENVMLSGLTSQRSPRQESSEASVRFTQDKFSYRHETLRWIYTATHFTGPTRSG
jgi:hypothetical protein